MPELFIPESEIISEALPRKTVGLRLSNSMAFLFRYSLAPAPTGSKTHGTLFIVTDLATFIAHFCHSLSKVPIFIVAAPLIAEQILAKASASSIA